MPEHIPLSPITNIIRNTYIRSVVLSKSIADTSSSNRSLSIDRLCQQATMKLQQPTSIARRPLGKEHNRQTSVHCCLHTLARLHRRSAMSPRNVNRPRHRRHPSHHRPACDLSLRNKHAWMNRRIHHDVQVAQVIRDHHSPFRKTTRDANLDAHPPHRPRTKTMQPIGSFLPRLRLLYRQSRSSHNKHSDHSNAASHSPKKIHLTQSSLI